MAAAAAAAGVEVGAAAAVISAAGGLEACATLVQDAGSREQSQKWPRAMRKGKEEPINEDAGAQQ